MYTQLNSGHTQYIVDIVTKLKEMYDESSYNTIGFDVSTCLENLTYKLFDDNSLVIIKLDEDKHIIAVLIAHIEQFMFNKNQLLAHNDILFVDKEHRGSSIGYRLIKMYREWAISKGVARVYLSESCEITSDRTQELFKAMGFEQFASIYKKEII